MLIFLSQGMSLFMKIPQLIADDVGIHISNNKCFEKIFNAKHPDSESLWIKIKSPNSSTSRNTNNWH